MVKQKDFDSFLKNIEPSDTTASYISSVQNNLRDYLAGHSKYKDIHVQTFLSGSYAKHTSIRPALYDGKRDVDIVVETTYASNASSCEVIQELLDVLLEKSIYSSAKLLSHSVGIELEGIEIDVVPVIRSEDGEIFRIGTSDIDEWILTDPKGHIQWSSQVNADNDKKYKPLVKMLKWWRRTNCPEEVKYPKGIALEKIIADNLPDSDLNTENHLIDAMQAIVDTYQEDYIDNGIKPEINDPCFDGNDLLAEYEFSDFKAFILKLSEHLTLITDKGSTNENWRTILGIEFPKDDSEQTSSSLKNVSYNYANTEQFIKDMFPINNIYKLKIDCNVTQDGWRPFTLFQFLRSGGSMLRHNKKLDFFIVSCDVPLPYSIYWKVRNVGETAEKRNCIRGQINKTDNSHQREHTNFYGPHYVECYIVKNDVCVAKDRIDVPIGTS